MRIKMFLILDNSLPVLWSDCTPDENYWWFLDFSIHVPFVWPKAMYIHPGTSNYTPDPRHQLCSWIVMRKHQAHWVLGYAYFLLTFHYWPGWYLSPRTWWVSNSHHILLTFSRKLPCLTNKSWDMTYCLLVPRAWNCKWSRQPHAVRAHVEIQRETTPCHMGDDAETHSEIYLMPQMFLSVFLNTYTWLKWLCPCMSVLWLLSLDTWVVT